MQQKNRDSLFYREKFNYYLIADCLYHGDKGAFLIGGAVKNDALLSLREEIRSQERLLKQAKKTYGRAEQRFKMHYWGTYETGSNEDPRFPLISRFAQAYTAFMQPLIQRAGLTQQRVSSIGVHIYEESALPGLGPHRDHSNVQLVSTFVLEGYAPFYIGKNHNLIDKITLDPRVGSLLLMRGPRNEQERKLANIKSQTYDPALDSRPIHCVGPVEEERIVVLLRHILEKKKC